MRRFITYLNQHVQLTHKETEMILGIVKTETFAANTNFHKSGDICRRIWFILDGIVRAYFYSEKGDEITKCFHGPNGFVVDLNSYNNEKISSEYFQSITASELMFITKEADTYLTRNLPKWTEITRKVSESVLVNKVNTGIELVHTDGKTKYLNFLKNNPNIANQIPLGFLSSYLGITQQSLSRIRKEILK